MRILMVTNNYTPYSGGVVSSIQATTAGLLAAGHSVKIVTLDFGNTLHEEHVIRIPSLLRCMYKKNPLAFPWRPKAMLNAIIRAYNPDIIHVHHPFLLGSIACSLGKKYKIPVVFTYHTLYTHYAHYVPLVPKSITQFLIHYWVKRFCSKVNALIAPSNSLKNELKSHGITTPITVLPSSILPLFYASHVQTNKKLGTQLICVCRFTPEKNLFFLLDTFAQLPKNFQLTLIGFGMLEQELRTYTYTLNVVDRVQFIIKPPKEEIARAYQKADICIFSSVTETQGLVLAEAMASGLPVVALHGPGVIDIVEHGVNGFIVHTQTDMRNAIMRIAHDSELLQKLSAGALQTAKGYRPEVLVAQCIDLYNQFI